jgi:hypothetical protein
LDTGWFTNVEKDFHAKTQRANTKDAKFSFKILCALCIPFASLQKNKLSWIVLLQAESYRRQGNNSVTEFPNLGK